MPNVKATGRDVMADGRVKVSILKEQSEKPGYSATSGRVQRLVRFVVYSSTNDPSDFIMKPSMLEVEYTGINPKSGF